MILIKKPDKIRIYKIKVKLISSQAKSKGISNLNILQNI